MQQIKPTYVNQIVVTVLNSSLTHWSLGNLDLILEMQFSVLFYWSVSSDLVIMPSDECYGTLSIISQHWFMYKGFVPSGKKLSQCWPRSLFPCGIAKPLWVKVAGIIMSLQNVPLFFQRFFGYQWVKMLLAEQAILFKIMEKISWDIAALEIL